MNLNYILELKRYNIKQSVSFLSENIEKEQEFSLYVKNAHVQLSAYDQQKVQ